MSDIYERFIGPKYLRVGSDFYASARVAYGYDSFGNLTAKTPTAGAPPSLSQAVNAANNQIVGQSYDANGNQVTAPGYSGSSTYDVENRLATAPGVQYAYDSQNKRVWAATVDGSNNLGSQTLNFYGVNGQLIGTYALSVIYGRVNPIADWPLSLAVYFGSKRIATIQSGTTTPYWQDRLGSNRTNASRYYPWGEDRSTPSNDQVRFATYTRDSATLLDYADQRYYGNAQGRFMTPDSAPKPRLADPQSWNKYAYVAGDPVDRVDPRGTDWCDLGFWDSVVPGTSCGGSVGTFDLSAVVENAIQSALAPEPVSLPGFDGPAFFFDPLTGSASLMDINWYDIFAFGATQTIPFPPGGTLEELFAWLEKLGLKVNNPWIIALSLSVGQISDGGGLPPDPSQCPKTSGTPLALLNTNGSGTLRGVSGTTQPAQVRSCILTSSGMEQSRRIGITQILWVVNGNAIRTGTSIRKGTSGGNRSRQLRGGANHRLIGASTGRNILLIAVL